MIWLTWRQFRLQALVALAALTTLAIYLVILGGQIRNSYDTDIVGCVPDQCANLKQLFIDRYNSPIGLIGGLLLGFPAIIGVFWGAPLIARELETGTHRLAWNQSVTRTRWLAVKLGLIAVFSVAVTGLLSLLLTWSASRFDQIQGDRFAALNFGARNIVPVGYAVFAFILGTVIGLLLRRTIPAMALTLTIFVVVQVLVPNAIRAEHFISPITTTVKFTPDVLERADQFGMSQSGKVSLGGYSVPGTWSLTKGETELVHADGTSVTAKEVEDCVATGGPGKVEPCIAALNLHFDYKYHPASRYWPFQWIELSIFLVLSTLLAGLGFWWIRYRPT